MVSQKQGNGNVSWVYYIHPSLALVLTNVDVGILYIHIRGAFSVARFDLPGKCESLYSVERVTGLAPRFFVCMYSQTFI